jgi:hypothetical protein
MVQTGAKTQAGGEMGGLLIIRYQDLTDRAVKKDPMTTADRQAAILVPNFKKFIPAVRLKKRFICMAGLIMNSPCRPSKLKKANLLKRSLRCTLGRYAL